MKKVFLIFLLLNSFLTGHAEEETEAVNVDASFEKKIIISNIKKIIMADPNIASAEPSFGGVTIKGKSLGSTQLYVWTDSGLKIYLVNTNSPDYGVPRKEFIRIKKYNDLKIPRGYYSNQLISNSNRLANNQTMFHSLYLNYPVDNESSFSFNGNLALNSENIISFKQINIPNAVLNYKRKNFDLYFGDTNAEYSNFAIGGINPTIRGLKASYYDLKNKFSFSTGLSARNYILYNRDNTQWQPLSEADPNLQNLFNSENNKVEPTPYITALNENYYVNDKLSLSGSFLSSVNINSLKDNIYNLSAGIKYHPLENMNFNIASGTSFSGLSVSAQSSYKHEFNSTKEKLLFQTSFFRNSQNYNLPIQDSYNFSLSGNHISGINIGSSINFLADNYKLNQSSFYFRADKDIFQKDLNLTTLFSINNLKNYQSKFFSTGLIFNPIKTSLTYNLINNEISSLSSFSNQLSASVQLISSDIFNMDFQTFFTNNVSQLVHNNNFITRISYNFNLFHNFGLSGACSYILSENTKPEDYLLNNISATYRFYNNDINLNATWENSLRRKQNSSPFYAGILYRYNFGDINSFHLKGNIKGIVYEDINNNDNFDKGENIIANTKVFLNDSFKLSDNTGFIFRDLDYDNYDIILDPLSLPDGYIIDTGNSKTVELDGDLKIVNFAVKKSRLVKGVIYADKNKKNILNNVKIILDESEEIYSDPSGFFSFKILPGKEHSLRVDLNSVPQGYILNGSLSKKIIFSDNETIEFVFYPVISLKAILYTENNSKKVPLKNKEISVNLERDDSITKETVITDDNGEFYLFDLDPSITSISSDAFLSPVKLELINEPKELTLEIKAKL